MRKRALMTMLVMLAAVSATAQVYSTGGASEEGYKSTIGNQNTAGGNYSLAAGSGCQSVGQSSIAMGFASKAGGLCSLALGMSVESQSDYSITIGRGQGLAEPLLNTTGGIMMGMGSSLPTFYISPQFSTNRTGKVGIGNVTDPQAKLHIRGDALEDADILLVSYAPFKSAIRFRNDDNSISLEPNNVMRIKALTTYLMIDAPKVCFGSAMTFLSNTDDEVFSIKAPNAIAQEAGTINLTASNNIQMTGKVGINTVNTNTGFALAVSGGILTDQVLIRDVSDWPDYVFGKGHALMSINNVKAFINKNHHLPDVPSAKEVEENGVNVAEMQKVLLKKIEELTLYTIEQQRLIEELQEKIERLENQ